MSTGIWPFIMTVAAANTIGFAALLGTGALIWCVIHLARR